MSSFKAMVAATRLLAEINKHYNSNKFYNNKKYCVKIFI